MTEKLMNSRLEIVKSSTQGKMVIVSFVMQIKYLCAKKLRFCSS